MIAVDGGAGPLVGGGVVVVVVESFGGVDVGVVVDEPPGPVVDVDDGSIVVSVDDVVVRSGFNFSPGNFVTDGKSPTSIPSVIALMYFFQMVAGNVPPNTVRPCTLFMNFGGPSSAALRYPIHTAVV